MLDLAIRHEAELQDLYQQTLFTEKYRFNMNYGAIDYNLELSQDASIIQMVSIHQDHLIGYLSARINRDTNTAYDIHIMNFMAKNDIFTADLFEFYIMLLNQFGIDRIVWNVIVGNPAEKLYDRLAENYGGRIVGTFKNDVRLYDGQLYDTKWYEMYKNQCMQAIKTKEVDGRSYRKAGDVI
ncbi:MAG: hypothetical protein ACM3QW_09000 [Ignavibacteriales bacterium]